MKWSKPLLASFALFAGVLIASAQTRMDPAVANAFAARRAALIKFPDLQVMPTSVLVRFKPGVPESTKSALRVGMQAVSLHKYTLVPGLELIDSPLGFSRAINALRKDPNVLYAEPDRVMRAQVLPNDPMFSSLWGLNNANNFDIDGPAGWDITTGDPNFVVADIDTGTQLDHPDLAANIWTNPGEIPGNGIDDDGDGYVDDVHGYDFFSNDGDPTDEHGHGTHTAGTIGAVGNNGAGVCGVNWHCKLMTLRFLGPSGSGSSADAIRALEYCVLKGVKVSNNSYGGDGFEQAFMDAIEATKSVGHIFCAAAGNANNNNDLNPFYPAGYTNDNVISVAAVDSNGNRAGFSNYGATTVQLGGPGVGIISTYPTNTYASLSGTSMATPHVAGVVALVYSHFPTWTYTQVRNRVLSTTKPTASLAGLTVTGGMVDAYNALVDTAPLVAITSPTNGASIVQGSSITFTGSATDAQDGDLTSSMTWTDSVMGAIGSGATFSRSDLSVGSHTITASATDAAGHVSSNSVTITVNNTAPTVTISAPANNTTVNQGTSVTFTGTASDAQDGNKTASIVWTSSLNGQIGTGATFSRSDLKAGTHTITAKVTDAGGLSGSATITLIVKNTAPTVSITAPANNSSFATGAAVTFKGTASDAQDGGLSSTIVWSSNIQGTLGSGATLTVSNLAVGTHTITAKVTDSGGLSATATITVTITGPIPAPPSGLSISRVKPGWGQLAGSLQ
jgi:molybdopterin synthase catalytic subunit